MLSIPVVWFLELYPISQIINLMLTKETILVGLFAFFIWGILSYVELTIIGATYPYVLQDNETGNFGIGLNWLTFDPLKYRHHPAPTSNLLYGLVVWFIEIDKTEKSLEQFIAIGIVIQAFIVALCSAWYSWITRVLKVDIISRLILVILVFSIPALLIRVGHPGFFFEIGVLGFPLGLTLYAALLGNEKAAIVSGIGLGVAAANFFLYWIIVAFFVIAYLFRWSPNRYSFRRLLSVSNANGKETGFIILLTIIAFAMYYGTVSFDSHQELKNSSEVSIGLMFIGLWISACLLGLIWFRWDNRTSRFALGFALAFAVSNFILLPWYVVGVISALNVTAGEPITLRPLFWFNEYPWFSIFWATLVLTIGSAIYKYRRLENDYETTRTYIFASIFSCASLLIIALANSPFLKGGNVPGFDERSMIVVIPPIAVGWLLILNAFTGRAKIGLQIVLVTLSLAIMIDFYTKYDDQINDNRTEGMLLDKTLRVFLSENREGSVICVGEEFSSKYCTTAYSYNRYRTKESAGRIETTNLFDQRLVSLGYRDWEMLLNPAHRAAVDAKIISKRVPSVVITLGGYYRDHLIELLEEAGLVVTPLWEYIVASEKSRLEEISTMEGNKDGYQMIPTYDQFQKRGTLPAGGVLGLFPQTLQFWYFEHAPHGKKIRWYRNFRKELVRARTMGDKGLFNSTLKNHGLLLRHDGWPEVPPDKAFVVFNRYRGLRRY